ncbi:hypothetical protein [Caenispirillum bisanense]|uniref:hypothetical protein n=1 Tax=Caenispirillum bisanense TaxID=414052 RepID=UPI0031DBEC76
MSRIQLMKVAAAVAAVLAVALLARFLMVEPRGASLMCASEQAAWWCPLRSALVPVFQWYVFGIVSVVAGLVGLVFGGRAWGVAALCAGAAGLVLYNAEPAAVGFVLGLIVVTRQREPSRRRGRKLR